MPPHGLTSMLVMLTASAAMLTKSDFNVSVGHREQELEK